MLKQYYPLNEENPITKYMSDKPYTGLKISPDTIAHIVESKYYDIFLTVDEKLFPKLFFRDYIAKYGKDDLERFVPFFIQLIYKFHPVFPYPFSDTKIETILNTIPKNITSPIDDIYFKNNISNIGSDYLKSRFFSYWKGSYGNSHSMVSAWKDYKLMYKIVKDRIGINTRNEVFDFSIKGIINGFKVHKHSISFFKPQVAANIYKYFLGDIEKPVVFDPTAGFGGRMLGFKAVYPKGIYIGNDANIETYNELQQLSFNFSGIILMNKKLEDLNINLDSVDLTFTSIPYFNTEVYSNNVNYSSKQEWEDSFIFKLKQLPRLLVNVDEKNSYLFNDIKVKEFKLVNNTSHFSDNSKKNYESIVKCF